MKLSTLVGTVALLGVASAGAADPTVELIWRKSGTSTVSASTTQPETLVADVVLIADQVSLSSLMVSISFDADGANELDYLSGGEIQVIDLGNGETLSPLALGISLEVESVVGLGGVLRQFDQTTSGAIQNTTLVIGSIGFTTNPDKIAEDGVDVVAELSSVGVDGAISSSGSPVTLLFTGASVNPD